MSTRYPIPWTVARQVAVAAFLGQRRSFRADALRCVDELEPSLKIFGGENIPLAGPYLVTINHYTRPYLQAWWLALATSAAIPDEIHWITTAGWTFPDQLRAGVISPMTRWAFRRVADVYGFTTMPPMPPDPRDTAERARAVRQVFTCVRRKNAPVIGLAPEGQDIEGGMLGAPPPGVGRFIQHLTDLGLRILPTGIYERADGLCVRFGQVYHLELKPDLPSVERDRQVCQVVMKQIACQLPDDLRGIYG